MKEKRILCIEVNGECRHFTDVNTPLLADAFECQQGLEADYQRRLQELQRR